MAVDGPWNTPGSKKQPEALPSNLVAEPTVSEERAVRNNPAGAAAIIKRQQADIVRLQRELWVIAEAIFQNVSSDDAKHWARGIKVSLSGPADAPPKFTVETSDEWRCFHCNEVFTDREKAAEHFGEHEMLQPACTIDVTEYRRMEEVNSRHCAEDTELHREIYKMSADHATALRREEERGYARGLEDAKKYPETIGLARGAVKTGADPS